jgi:hypothetical protein
MVVQAAVVVPSHVVEGVLAHVVERDLLEEAGGDDLVGVDVVAADGDGGAGDGGYGVVRCGGHIVGTYFVLRIS